MIVDLSGFGGGYRIYIRMQNRWILGDSLE